jgi:hypothetical protein
MLAGRGNFSPTDPRSLLAAADPRMGSGVHVDHTPVTTYYSTKEHAIHFINIICLLKIVSLLFPLCIE